MAKEVGISAGSVYKLWKSNDLKPHLVRTFKLSPSRLWNKIIKGKSDFFFAAEAQQIEHEHDSSKLRNPDINYSYLVNSLSPLSPGARESSLTQLARHPGLIWIQVDGRRQLSRRREAFAPATLRFPRHRLTPQQNPETL